MFKAHLIFVGNPDTIGPDLLCRGLSFGVNGDRRGQGAQRRYVGCRGRRGIRRRQNSRRWFNLPRPCHHCVIPSRFVRGEVGEGVEEGRLSATGSQCLSKSARPKTPQGTPMLTQSPPGRYLTEWGMLKVADIMFPLSARSGLTERISLSDSLLPPMAARLMRRSISLPDSSFFAGCVGVSLSSVGTTSGFEESK